MTSGKCQLKNVGRALYDETQSQASSFSDGREGKHENQETSINSGKHCSPPPSEDGNRIREISRAQPSIHHRRKGIRDFQPPNNVPSPRPTVPTRPPSPMQAVSSSRLLPSPSSMNFSMSSNILPPMSPSLLFSQSPHTAHLQELQHQLSTKSLAHQILLGEHDKLLAAFSRSRTRCEALDKKSQVSEREINEISELNIKYQAQIDALDIQVQGLQQARDEMMRQNTASIQQYMKIVDMSSKLQAQAVIDQRKWKEDGEKWEKQKRELLPQEPLAGLRNPESQSSIITRPVNPTNMLALPDPNNQPDSSIEHSLLPTNDPALSILPSKALDPSVSHSDPPVSFSDAWASPAGTLTNTSVPALRLENQLLRQKNQDAEALLAELRAQAEHVDGVVMTLGGISRCLRGVDHKLVDDKEGEGEGEGERMGLSEEGSVN